MTLRRPHLGHGSPRVSCKHATRVVSLLIPCCQQAKVPGACRQKREIKRNRQSDSPRQDGTQMRTSPCWSSRALTCCGSVKIGRNQTGGARPTPTCPPQPCKPISSAWSLSVPMPERASLHRVFPSCPTTRASTPLLSASAQAEEERAPGCAQQPMNAWSLAGAPASPSPSRRDPHQSALAARASKPSFFPTKQLPGVN